MAGIGFELKRLFRSEQALDKLRGVSYATLVSVGPMIMSIGMILALGGILKALHAPTQDREFVVASIMYAYVFAMINVSGLVMVLSRYLADRIYINETRDVLASLAGATALVSLTGEIFGAAFFAASPLPVLIKLPSYFLWIEMSVLFLLLTYVSALKNYKRIAFAYGVGVLLTLAGSTTLILIGADVTVSVMYSIACGFLATLVLLLVTLRRAFGHLSDRPYAFLVNVKKMPLLFLTNAFYTVALFAHNFLFWRFSEQSVELGATYLTAPSYDSATFLAVLTIIPMTVMFVVRFETTFYDSYRTLCRTISRGGTLKSIQLAKTRMIETIRKEISSIFEIQLIISVFLIVFGVLIVLPLFGSDGQNKAVFALMAIGYILSYMTFIVITLLLYFDDQESTVATAAIFLGATVLSTGLSILAGERFHGLGLLAGALVSLIAGLFFLGRTVQQIDYRMFSKDPYMILEDSGWKADDLERPVKVSYDD